MIIILKGRVSDVQEWQNEILKKVANNHNVTIKEVKTFTHTTTKKDGTEYEQLTQEIVLTRGDTGIEGIPF